MLQRKNLLLVEDNAIVSSALCELLLASDEYYVTKAESCDDVHLFFIDNHFENFFPLSGDRLFGEDKSSVAGLAKFEGQSV